jgi:hypothetical protein
MVATCVGIQLAAIATTTSTPAAASASDAKPLADRILVREQPPRQFLADDNPARRRHVVLRGEGPAAQERNADRLRNTRLRGPVRRCPRSISLRV